MTDSAKELIALGPTDWTKSLAPWYAAQAKDRAANAKLWAQQREAQVKVAKAQGVGPVLKQLAGLSQTIASAVTTAQVMDRQNEAAFKKEFDQDFYSSDWNPTEIQFRDEYIRKREEVDGDDKLLQEWYKSKKAALPKDDDRFDEMYSELKRYSGKQLARATELVVTQKHATLTPGAFENALAAAVEGIEISGVNVTHQSYGNLSVEDKNIHYKNWMIKELSPYGVNKEFIAAVVSPEFKRKSSTQKNLNKAVSVTQASEEDIAKRKEFLTTINNNPSLFAATATQEISEIDSNLSEAELLEAEERGITRQEFAIEKFTNQLSGWIPGNISNENLESWFEHAIKHRGSDADKTIYDAFFKRKDGKYYNHLVSVANASKGLILSNAQSGAEARATALMEGALTAGTMTQDQFDLEAQRLFGLVSPKTKTRLENFSVLAQSKSEYDRVNEHWQGVRMEGELYKNIEEIKLIKHVGLRNQYLKLAKAQKSFYDLNKSSYNEEVIKNMVIKMRRGNSYDQNSTQIPQDAQIIQDIIKFDRRTLATLIENGDPNPLLTLTTAREDYLNRNGWGTDRGKFGLSEAQGGEDATWTGFNQIREELQNSNKTNSKLVAGVMHRRLTTPDPVTRYQKLDQLLPRRLVTFIVQNKRLPAEARRIFALENIDADKGLEYVMNSIIKNDPEYAERWNLKRLQNEKPPEANLAEALVKGIENEEGNTKNQLLYLNASLRNYGFDYFTPSQRRRLYKIIAQTSPELSDRDRQLDNMAVGVAGMEAIERDKELDPNFDTRLRPNRPLTNLK